MITDRSHANSAAHSHTSYTNESYKYQTNHSNDQDMPKKPNRTNNIRVIKNEENPETPEILAAALIKIGDAMEKLQQKGGLNDDAIAALIVNMSGMQGKVTKGSVRLVMDGLSRLKSYYIRK